MKRFGVVNNSDGSIGVVYDSEAVDYAYFGGPWGDATCCRHIELREDAHGLALDQIEVKNVQVQTGTQMVPCGMKAALDENGDPLMGSDGEPIEVQDYDEEPVYAQEDRIIPKS